MLLFGFAAEAQFACATPAWPSLGAYEGEALRRVKMPLDRYWRRFLTEGTVGDSPSDEAECGHHYARALSSWSVLKAWK